MDSYTVSKNAGRTPVTVIGLGPMGSALAGAFVENGFASLVEVLGPERAEREKRIGDLHRD